MTDELRAGGAKAEQEAKGAEEGAEPLPASDVEVDPEVTARLHQILSAWQVPHRARLPPPCHPAPGLRACARA